MAKSTGTRQLLGLARPSAEPWHLDEAGRRCVTSGAGTPSPEPCHPLLHWLGSGILQRTRIKDRSDFWGEAGLKGSRSGKGPASRLDIPAGESQASSFTLNLSCSFHETGEIMATT